MAKAPKPPQAKAKSRAKEKEKSKFPETGEKDPSQPTYDYHEGSIHDIALRQDILRGYERFKVSLRPLSRRSNDKRHAISSLMDRSPRYYPH